MAEEALERETKRREKAEARLEVVTDVLERAAEEDEWREVDESERRLEEGKWLEVQRLMEERWIEDLKRMEAKLLEA